MGSEARTHVVRRRVSGGSRLLPWWARLAVLLLAAPAANAQLVLELSDFEWTLGGDPSGTGWVSDTQLHVTGPDTGSCRGEPKGVTHLTAPAPAYPGTVTATFTFDNQDTGPSFWHFEHPVTMLNGQKVPVGDPNTSFSDVFEVSFDVQPGDVFGFGIHSVDCHSGPGVADITDFQFVYQAGAWHDLGEALRAAVVFHASDVYAGPAASSGLEMVVAAVGDVDGDGLPDLAEGRPESDLVRVLSGADGSVLHEWTRPGRFGAAVAGAGDVDHDGHDDVLVGAPFDTSNGPLSGRAYLLSGFDGSEIHVVTGQAGDELGAAVSGGAGNGFLVGLPRGPTDQGAVHAFSKTHGGLIGAQLPLSPDAGTRFGAVVATTSPLAGGDGDWIVADPAWEGGRGRVYVFPQSGLLPEVVADGSSPDAGFGASLAGLGDVDGDGLDEFAIGAPGELVGEEPTGTVSVWGRDPQHFLKLGRKALHEGAGPGERFGAAVAGGRDVDLDGLPDLAIGAPGHAGGAGRFEVRNGADGTLHADVAGAPGEALGGALALFGEIDGSGGSAVAAAAPGAAAGAGALTVLHGVEGTGGAPLLTASGAQLAGAPTFLRLTKAKSGAPAVLVVGFGALSAPLAGGTLVPAPDVLVPLATSPGGKAIVAFAWPHGLPIGLELYWQGWILDPLGPQGFTATNALLSVGGLPREP